MVAQKEKHCYTLLTQKKTHWNQHSYSIISILYNWTLKKSDWCFIIVLITITILWAKNDRHSVWTTSEWKVEDETQKRCYVLIANRKKRTWYSVCQIHAEKKIAMPPNWSQEKKNENRDHCSLKFIRFLITPIPRFSSVATWVSLFSLPGLNMQLE